MSGTLFARCPECRRLILVIGGPLINPTDPLTGRTKILRSHKAITAAEALAAGKSSYFGRPECRGSRKRVQEDRVMTTEVTTPGPAAVPPAD